MTSITHKEYQPKLVFHPGETLAEKLDELGIGSKEFAVRTGKPEQTISNVLHGKSSITADMAVLFEFVTKIPISFWLKRQSDYDAYVAIKKREQKLKENISWSELFPYNNMAAFNWVDDTRVATERIQSLLSFFGIAVQEAWVDYYLNQKLAGNFRISLKATKNPYALSAWIRRGEILAAAMNVVDYNKTALINALPLLKKIMADANGNVLSDIQNVLNSAGVKFVYVPSLPKVSASGLSRWINGSPVVQVSDRMKRYDIFWFSLFHELGHILYHKSKFISLENVDYSDKDLEKEKEADEFAVKWTFSIKEECHFLSQGDYSKDAIMKYAAHIGTHPSIIGGRLAYKNIISNAALAAMQLGCKLVFIDA